MEMISRVKMKKAIDVVLDMRPYALYAQELLAQLAQEKFLESSLFSPASGKKLLFIIVGADKGLCGAYNANVTRHLIREIENSSVASIEAITVGKKAALEAKKLGIEIISRHDNFPEGAALSDAAVISALAQERFLTGAYAEVRILFTDYVSSFSQKVRTRVLLPVTLEHIDTLLKEAAFAGEREERLPKENFAQYVIEPSPEAILHAVLPGLIEAQILHSILESRASEESMRMFAMKNATENANELEADLVLSYNRSRQKGITQEIAEIAAGAEAIT